MDRTWFLLAIGFALPAMQLQPVTPPVQPSAPSRPPAAIRAKTPDTDTSYLDIVARYRAGAFENAVEALASHVDAHSSAFAMGQLEKADPEVGNQFLALFPMAKQAAALALAPVLPAAAALHLETGHYLLQKADDKRALGHLMAARTIVDGEWWTTVPAMLPDRLGHYEKVRHDIYRGITLALQQYHQFELLLPHLERSREQFPKDADILLALGTLDELRATAVMLRQVELPKKENPSASWRRRQRREYLDKAAAHFRDALSIDATLAEARVRLGRVLQERGKLPEARRELEAAIVAAPPPAIVHYFASLFLGEVLEAQGDTAGAIARYRETVTRWPECQSAQLALSRAFEAAGDRHAAADALQPLWRAEAERKCVVDPWWLYNEGQSWRMRPLIEDLRGSVKDKS
jgi:tetratricopeptide (TPR) repeat protein